MSIECERPDAVRLLIFLVSVRSSSIQTLPRAVVFCLLWPQAIRRTVGAEARRALVGVSTGASTGLMAP